MKSGVFGTLLHKDTLFFIGKAFSTSNYFQRRCVINRVHTETEKKNKDVTQNIESTIKLLT